MKRFLLWFDQHSNIHWVVILMPHCFAVFFVKNCTNICKNFLSTKPNFKFDIPKSKLIFQKTFSLEVIKNFINDKNYFLGRYADTNLLLFFWPIFFYIFNVLFYSYYHFIRNNNIIWIIIFENLYCYYIVLINICNN